MLSFPVLLTIYAGFAHAFEADHLLAVSSIVTNRSRLGLAVKDGLYWGLGHTSTILIVGLLMIVFRLSIEPGTFHYFEAIVGAMLIALALYRLYKFNLNAKKGFTGTRPHAHLDGTIHSHDMRGHRLAYGVGLVHGLAGSGSIVVLVLSQIQSPAEGIMYLLIFGLGSVVGMFLVAGLLSTPFSKRAIQSVSLQTVLILLSSVLCIAYGSRVIYQNLLAS